MVNTTSKFVFRLTISIIIILVASCGQPYSPSALSVSIETSTPSQIPTPTFPEPPTQIPIATQLPTQAESTPVPTPTPIVFPTEYTIKIGDTLGEISRFFGVPVAYIAVKNGISNTNLIFPGQVLIIPDPSEPPEEVADSGKQIIVVLSLQTAYAYENGELIREFIVSTGLPDTPTVQGSFAIYIKYESTRMQGPGYDLQNVPWTMYFFEGYGLHGTYWHSNFGFPMSHGCVNMKTEEAHWLFDWAPQGTSVLVFP